MIALDRIDQKPMSKRGKMKSGSLKLPDDITTKLKQAKALTEPLMGGEPLASGYECVLLCPVFVLPHHGGTSNEQKTDNREGLKDCAGTFRKILDQTSTEPNAFTGPDPMNKPWMRAPRVAHCGYGA